MCQICVSSLVAELNKKANWRPDRVIKWAGRRGLVINEKQLQDHFASHVKNRPPAKSPAEIILQEPSAASVEKQVVRASSNAPDSRVSDEGFLNKVIGDVFESLAAGQFDLKLEYGFKAIELKQKIAENTNIENRLLELLNEIRSQELSSIRENSSRD